MNISMLLYGAAGSGKSILASTFPKPLIIDTDNSHKIYENAKAFPDAIYVRGGASIPALQKAIGQIKDGTNTFQTLIIDSLTALENMAITQFKGLSSENWETNLYTNRGKNLNYTDWGSISGSTIALLSELRSYPVNIVIITQLAKTYVDNTEKFLPELVGKSQGESLHFADIVGYMEVVEDVSGVARLLHLSSTANDKFTAKVRTIAGNLKPVKNPNYDKLVKVLDTKKNNLKFND
jgi:hypothetical protein